MLKSLGDLMKVGEGVGKVDLSLARGAAPSPSQLGGLEEGGEGVLAAALHLYVENVALLGGSGERFEGVLGGVGGRGPAGSSPRGGQRGRASDVPVVGGLARIEGYVGASAAAGEGPVGVVEEVPRGIFRLPLKAVFVGEGEALAFLPRGSGGVVEMGVVGGGVVKMYVVAVFSFEGEAHVGGVAGFGGGRGGGSDAADAGEVGGFPLSRALFSVVVHVQFDPGGVVAHDVWMVEEGEPLHLP
mmetsp:Transcript_13345/g.29426  ORF Transcript_13345/g.29426 Transcript_13345/m.29426 type:complete len:243 (-) Transcript_13345:345-1073(-)